MLKRKRIQIICDELNKNGVISIDDLAKQLEISPSTIRRDIHELEENHMVRRIRGGAIPVAANTPHELPFSMRTDIFKEEKARIAEAAKQYIHENDTLIVGSGTTTLAFAKTLSDISPLYVATSDLMSALELSTFPNVELTVLGGALRHFHHSITGYFAEQMLNQIHADTAFVGIDAIDFNLGLMNFSTEDVAVNKLILKAATQKVILCDHSKFDAIAFANVCSLDQIDVLITGKETDTIYLDRLREMGVKTIVA